MNIDFPSLATINKHASTYKGPIVLFSASDINASVGARFHYTCGHQAGAQRIYDPPEMMIDYLDEKDLLATTGGFFDVVLFDPHLRRSDVVGHREVMDCPQCFFERALLAIGPCCGICGEILSPNEEVVLLPFDRLRKAHNRLNVLRAKIKQQEQLIACGIHRRMRNAIIGAFYWNGTTLIPGKH